METTEDTTVQPTIKFGPKPHQVISPEVASLMLTLWRDRNPAQFGSYLGEVMTGERPAATRERKAAKS